MDSLLESGVLWGFLLDLEVKRLLWPLEQLHNLPEDGDSPGWEEIPAVSAFQPKLCVSLVQVSLAPAFTCISLACRRLRGTPAFTDSYIGRPSFPQRIPITRKIKDCIDTPPASQNWVAVQSLQLSWVCLRFGDGFLSQAWLE